MLLRRIGLRATFRRACVLASAGVAASIAIWGLAPSSTESAVANGDTRTLHLYHTHSLETIDATYRVDGHYDRAVLAQLNHFLRDWRNNDEHEMDPRLFDAVWEAYRTAGASDRIHIYSAYRSPETNAMLRRRSRAVAEHSQHMLGKAMDTTMPGFPMSRIREAGMKLQHGGVGWYPSANFVHLDVGGVRSWPRMPYDQLARIFPDGKTVHIAADGRTMPGYDQARVEITQRDGIDAAPPAQQSQGFFAWLFGGSGGGGSREGDEEERRAPVAVAAATQAVPQPAAYQPQPESAPQPAPAPALAYADATGAQPQEAAPRDQIAAAPAAQVAALEPADADKAVGFVSVLPPRRPVEFAMETPDVPLPPIRPDVLDRVQTASIRFTDAQTAPVRSDKIGSLIATSSGVPTMRGGSLPAIITRGGEKRPAVPAQVMAFAAPESVPMLKAVPLPVSRPADLVRPLALRGARRRVATVAPIVQAVPVAAMPAAVEPPATFTGPRLTGLRRAAKQMEANAAL